MAVKLVVACTTVLWGAAGCRSTARHQALADRRVADISNRLGAEEAGRETPFELERPADTLRRRLLEEQRLPTQANLRPGDPDGPPQPLRLTLTEALQVGARYSSDYQDRKEAVFRAALSLDLEAEEFRTSWAGVLSGQYSDDRGGEQRRRGATVSAEPSASRLLAAGASVTSRLAFDLARLFSLDRDSAYGLMADLSLSVPLLRGSGRRVVMEAMTQAERQVVYAIYDFERYKRVYAARIGVEYLGVLERHQQILNAEDNYRRLQLSVERAERLAAAGRLPAVQVDQTRQDELRARERVINARQAYQRQLDEFKQTLGLPVDALVELDGQELERLGATDPAAAAGHRSGNTSDDHESLSAAAWRGLTGVAILERALENRLDLLRAAGRLADAERHVAVAEDGLRSGLTLEAHAQAGDRRDSGSADRGDARLRPSAGRFRTLLRWEAPWQRARARHRYRESLWDLDRAQRAREDMEDTVKQQVRDHVRNLQQALESIRIQERAVEVAERRVASTELFQQAGRAQIRDVLEAEEALVSARNALVSARVRYRATELNLQRDMGTLHVTDEGLWNEYEPDT